MSSQNHRWSNLNCLYLSQHHTVFMLRLGLGTNPLLSLGNFMDWSRSHSLTSCEINLFWSQKSRNCRQQVFNLRKGWKYPAVWRSCEITEQSIYRTTLSMFCSCWRVSSLDLCSPAEVSWFLQLLQLLKRPFFFQRPDLSSVTFSFSQIS